MMHEVKWDRAAQSQRCAGKEEDAQRREGERQGGRERWSFRCLMERIM